jgi:hypothetical protein
VGNGFSNFRGVFVGSGGWVRGFGPISTKRCDSTMKDSAKPSNTFYRNIVLGGGKKTAA